jgi:hypothetical protein
MKAPTLLMLVGLSISTAQAAEPTGTLTLACQGMTKEIAPPLGAKPEPISMGIMLDFAARTLEGFGSDVTFRIGIGNITETALDFSGSNVSDLTRSYTYQISGTMDRVTGTVEAVFTGSMKDGPRWSTGYSLQCKPTQRMF